MERLRGRRTGNLPEGGLSFLFEKDLLKRRNYLLPTIVLTRKVRAQTPVGERIFFSMMKNKIKSS